MKNESPATAGLAIRGCSSSRLTASSSNFRPGLMTVQTALSATLAKHKVTLAAPAPVKVPAAVAAGAKK